MRVEGRHIEYLHEKPGASYFYGDSSLTSALSSFQQAKMISWMASVAWESCRIVSFLLCLCSDQTVPLLHLMFLCTQSPEVFLSLSPPLSFSLMAFCSLWLLFNLPLRMSRALSSPFTSLSLRIIHHLDSSSITCVSHPWLPLTCHPLRDPLSFASIPVVPGEMETSWEVVGEWILSIEEGEHGGLLVLLPASHISERPCVFSNTVKPTAKPDVVAR